MVATFWERAGAKGEGESVPFGMRIFETGLVLFAKGLIDVEGVRMVVGLTVEQGAELDQFLTECFPAASPLTEKITWVREVCEIFNGARDFVPQLETIEQMQTALEFVPPLLLVEEETAEEETAELPVGG